MFYTSLNFSIHVTDFDPASYSLESTSLLFRNSTLVPLFLFRVRTTQQSQTRFLLPAQFWTSLGLRKFGLFLLQVHFLTLGDSFERKSRSENGKAINMQNL